MLFSWKGSGHEPGLKEKKERQSVNGAPEEQKGFRKKNTRFSSFSHLAAGGIAMYAFTE